MDGAGKSSMVKRLSASFGTFMECTTLTLGKPQGNVIEVFRKLWQKKIMGTKPSSKGMVKGTSLSSAISSVVLGLLRLMMARKAVKLASKGSMVIVDRWSTDSFGKMDSPKIIVTEDCSYMIKLLGHVEGKVYSLIPSASLCFYLTVSSDTAVLRNDCRDKTGKETKSEIILRHEQNHEVYPRAHKLIKFDNEGPFDEKFYELQRLIWLEISLFKKLL